MVDYLTIAALALSIVTLASVMLLLVTIHRRPVATGLGTSSLESTVNEVKGLVTGLQGPVSQMLNTVGAIKQTTDQTSSGLGDVKRFTDLLSGSSQKRGRAGEIIVRQYLERLPREMWEEQYTIPGSHGRVDYALRIYNNGSQLLLPIDSKFSLPEGVGDFDGVANGLARERAVEVVKYIVPSVTTDFAVMVLPNPVYYALTSETIEMMQEAKIVPCPSEGVMMLCTLAMRAQQAVVLAQSADRLRSYVIEIDTKLGRVRADVSKWAKNLNGASRYARQTLEDLDDTRGSLGAITMHLDESESGQLLNRQLESSPSILTDHTVDDPADET